jgi:hypothetical protein
MSLRGWLPSVLQAVKPWVSAHDIAKGERGYAEIAQSLEKCSFGILCVTAENQQKPWLNFEAGALSKQVDSSRVAPLLLFGRQTPTSCPDR